MENKILVVYASKSAPTHVSGVRSHRSGAVPAGEGGTVRRTPGQIRGRLGWLPGSGRRQRHPHGRLAGGSGGVRRGQPGTGWGKCTSMLTVHLQALDDSQESQKQRETYIEPLGKLFSPGQAAFFAGRMDFSKLSFFERTIFPKP